MVKVREVISMISCTIRNHFLGSTILTVVLLVGSVFFFFIGSSFDYNPNKLTVLGQAFLLATFATVAYQARKRQRFSRNYIWLGIEALAILYIVISFVSFVGYVTTPCLDLFCRPFFKDIIGILVVEWVVIAPLSIIAYAYVSLAKTSAK